MSNELDVVREWYIENSTMVEYVMTSIKCLCALFTMLFMVKFGSDSLINRYDEAKELIVNGVSQQLRNSKNNMFNYSYQRKRLDSYGVTYRTKGKVTPTEFLLSKTIMAIVGAAFGVIVVMFGIEAKGLFGTGYTILFAVIFGAGLFFLPDIDMIEANKKDNNDMLTDVLNIFQCVVLQGSSGDNISKIITEAFLIVKNKRLETALLELSGALNSDTNAVVALEVFSNKFNSEAVSNLAVCLRQMIEIGDYEVQMKNAERHIEVLREADYKAKISKENRRAVYLGIALFAGIIAIFIYLVASGLLSEIVGILD